MGEKEKANELSKQIIGAAIRVHRALGPGLLESAYEARLCHELDLLGLHYQRQAIVPIWVDGVLIAEGFRADLVVEDCVIVELKAVSRLEPIHVAQLMTYLRLSNHWLGLLINFNVRILRDGIVRRVNGFPPD